MQTGAGLSRFHTSLLHKAAQRRHEGDALSWRARARCDFGGRLDRSRLIWRVLRQSWAVGLSFSIMPYPPAWRACHRPSLSTHRWPGVGRAGPESTCTHPLFGGAASRWGLEANALTKWMTARRCTNMLAGPPLAVGARVAGCRLLHPRPPWSAQVGEAKVRSMTSSRWIGGDLC